MWNLACEFVKQYYIKTQSAVEQLLGAHNGHCIIFSFVVLGVELKLVHLSGKQTAESHHQPKVNF